MNLFSKCAFAVLTVALASTAASPVFAKGSVVHVTLWDKGPDSMDMMGTGVMLGMAMHGTKPGKAMMGVTADKKSVSAGEVTFEVTNKSKDLIHEMVISPVANDSKPLPYDTTMENVKEDAAGHLGEVSELDPGKTGALRITLKPGTYILYCNVPGHYSMGMWTLIKVKT